ncbi:cytochrome o ubiquinol oxidase subunit IV [Aureimonas fodinaquatilis]|uniref:Cytochrome bo(3) ubiquinol oxidase subunit 4 n=1 Tax=Aureimonas fodinaquatilis TaxID=2565783 RepID=A0A5B0DU36_9HYPH|nr:cytochrome o ubiquinol oxidase subunit IV [Aureimonas fodinaquatilis]KAA0969070.1 cytochrome o ubiquinol oxidase subunit IV [Aureimonas fodinaquatilis]
MTNNASNDAHATGHEDENRERRSYVVGFVLATVLTIIAFCLVALKILPPGNMLAVLGVLAVVQTAVHLRCFLHIDHERSHRDDLRLVLLTLLMISIVIGGTIWILWDQHMRMML